MPMLLLNINRKPYMGSPIAHLHLTLSDLERSKSRSLRFRSLISRKGAQLGPMLLLNINRKPYMGSPMALSYLTLSDLERSRSPKFQSLIPSKGRQLRPMLLLNTNRKPYMRSPMASSHLTLGDLERSKSRSPDFEGLYLAKVPCQTLCHYQTSIGNHIWGVQWHNEI